MLGWSRFPLLSLLARHALASPKQIELLKLRRQTWWSLVAGLLKEQLLAHCHMSQLVELLAKSKPPKTNTSLVKPAARLTLIPLSQCCPPYLLGPSLNAVSFSEWRGCTICAPEPLCRSVAASRQKEQLLACLHVLRQCSPSRSL